MSIEKQNLRLQSLPKLHYEQLIHLYKQVKEDGLESEAFNQLYKALHQTQIIFSFDWMGWPPAKEARKNYDYNFQNLSLLELSQHLTAIVKADHYEEGTIVSAFNKGVFEKIFQSMAQRIQELNN